MIARWRAARKSQEMAEAKARKEKRFGAAGQIGSRRKA